MLRDMLVSKAKTMTKPPLNDINAIRHLVLNDRDITAEEIIDTLDKLDLDPPTRFYIVSTKRQLLDLMRFLRKQGLLVDKLHTLPTSLRRARKQVSNQNTDDVLPTGERNLLGSRSTPVEARTPRKRSKRTPKSYKDFYYK
jgi:hypothetical protein